jgi:hypothetical protein
MSEIVRNKDQITATVSPWIKKQCLSLANSEDFSSMSDVVSQALIEFFDRYYEKKKMQNESKYEEFRKFMDKYDKENSSH